MFVSLYHRFSTLVLVDLSKKVMFVKINKIKGKINTIIGLATNAALNDVKTRYPILLI